MAMRLDKYLTALSIGSRSEVKKFINQGRVTVNDQICKDAGLHVSKEDHVAFDGEKLGAAGGFRYFILNKPAGVITATRDERDKTVLDLLPVGLRRNLSPVGRLDKDTRGLLLLTDDGKLGHRLLSPKHHVAKQYYVETNLPLPEDAGFQFEKGIDIGDDIPCRPAELEILEDKKYLLTIYEGRFHQVKRMIKALGSSVLYLKRMSMGKLVLPEDLPEGEYRELTEEEIKCLQE